MKTQHILIVLQVIAWILFVGLCIEAGGFIVNTVFVILYNPAGAAKFWTQVNLSELYYFSQSHFITQTSLLVIVSVLKALMFYLIVKIFHDKRLNLANPFNRSTGRFIMNIGYIALGIGIFSAWGASFSGQMVLSGIQMPDIRDMGFGGADVWLFMSISLLVIAHIFKRGIELQTENDLTI
jgi:hypothetical protein